LAVACRGYILARVPYPSLRYAYAFDPFLQDYLLLPRGLEDYSLKDYSPLERELDYLSSLRALKRPSLKSAAPVDYSEKSVAPVDYSKNSASPVDYSLKSASPVDYFELSRNLDQYLGSAWSLAGKH